jgi:hypothetical protein
VSEAQFQDAVCAYARLTGWRWCHFRAARTAYGWRTPVSGDTGLPDLILCRDDRLVFVELKADRGRLRPDQRAWLAALEQTSAEVYCWRPRDWPAIEAALR